MADVRARGTTVPVGRRRRTGHPAGTEHHQRRSSGHKATGSCISTRSHPGQGPRPDPGRQRALLRGRDQYLPVDATASHGQSPPVRTRRAGARPDRPACGRPYGQALRSVQGHDDPGDGEHRSAEPMVNLSRLPGRAKLASKRSERSDAGEGDDDEDGGMLIRVRRTISDVSVPV
jgi:hypothetical protein